MTDSTEIEALQASFRGAVSTAAALEALKERVSSLDPRDEIADTDLEELARVSLAHAVASQALRGLVDSMRSRRRASASGSGAPQL